MGVLQGLPGQARYKLPETISEWLRIWTEKPRWGNYSIYEDDFFCYCPYNLQSYRMTCHSDIAVAVGCYPSVDMELALANMNAVTVLGVMEAYHESYCLLAAKLLGTLPGHCDCQDFDAWNSYSATRDDHGVQQDKGVAGLSAETLQMIDDMTQQDQLSKPQPAVSLCVCVLAGLGAHACCVRASVPLRVCTSVRKRAGEISFGAACLRARMRACRCVCVYVHTCCCACSCCGCQCRCVCAGVCLCACAHVRACVRAYVRSCIRVFGCVCVPVCVGAFRFCRPMRARACMRACMSACVCVCVWMCMLLRLCECVCFCVRVC